MYFKESTNPSKILTNDYTEKFYLRDQRVKPLRKREQLPTNESRISSQSSIYGNNVTLEDSIEKNLEPLKQYKQDAVIEKGHYPQNHVHIQAEGKLKCACTICTAQNLMRTEPDDPFTDPFFVNLQNGLNDHQVSLERGFVFVLKRLMPLRHMTHGLSIKVPETLVYIDGEAKFFALTGKDKTLKFLNQREKLAQHEIRKFFYERFALKDEEQRISDSRNALESKHLLPSTNEISTERTQGIDLRKGTPSSQLGIGKIARHKATKSLKIKPLPASREVALLKFNDDSTTILCEPEFENLIIKKKFDPYWRNIAFIQNYRGFSKYIHTLQRVYFIYDREKNNPLFTRASVEVYQLIKEIAPSSDSYIPAFEEENFQKNLRKHSESDYCLYLIMKVFHFIEIVHGYKINKMCGEFVKDINDVLWLTNVTHLQYQKKVARGVDENHGKVRSMFNLDTEERSSIQDSLHEIKRKDDVNVLSELMQKQYNNIKGSVGIKEPVPTYQEDISDNIFSQLYPNAPYRLSMLLKANSKPNHVNNPKNIASDNSFRVNSTRRTLEDERQLPSGPIKGVYMGMTRNTPSQNNVTSHNTSAIGNQSNRNSVIKKRVVKPRGESNENLSKQSRTPMPSMPSLPSLGNIDGYTNVSMAVEPKKQAQKSGDGRSTRSNSQPNMKKTFKFYGLNPNIANQYPKITSDTFKDAAHQRTLQRTPSDLIAHIPKMTKLTTMEGDVYTERCTPVGDRSRNSNPNTPYRKGLRGLSREAQGKLAVQLDQGSTTKRSQSVNKRALGYILNN